jgi:hypothetical protein
MRITNLQIAGSIISPIAIGCATTAIAGHLRKVPPRLSILVGLISGLAYLGLELIGWILINKRYKQMKSNKVSKQEARDIYSRNEHILKAVLTVFQTIAIGVALKYFSMNSENSEKSFAFLSLVSLGRIGVIINCKGRKHCLYV